MGSHLPSRSLTLLRSEVCACHLDGVQTLAPCSHHQPLLPNQGAGCSPPCEQPRAPCYKVPPFLELMQDKPDAPSPDCMSLPRASDPAPLPHRRLPPGPAPHHPSAHGPSLSLEVSKIHRVPQRGSERPPDQCAD